MPSARAFRNWFTHRRAGEFENTTPFRELIFQTVRDVPGRRRIEDLVPSLLADETIDRQELVSVARTLAYYGDAETIEIAADAPEALPALHQARLGTYDAPQPFVCTVDDVTLLGPYPVPFAADGRIVAEAMGKPRILELNVVRSMDRTLLRSCFSPWASGADVEPTRRLDTAVLLYNAWSDGYFHWIFDDLTRLQGVRAYERRTGERPALLLGPDPPSWQLRLLELLGFDEGDFVYWTNEPTSVDSLVVPSVRRTEIVSQDCCEWLHSEIVGRAGDAGDEFSSYVYVSRADADRRHVLNEDEVLDRLDHWGFERYVPTELSVEEQVSLFEGAEVVVGPHGANLTNVVFNSGGTLVEIFGDLTYPGNFVTCQLLGNGYRSFQATPVGADVLVDVDELESVVADVVTSS